MAEMSRQGHPRRRDYFQHRHQHQIRRGRWRQHRTCGNRVGQPDHRDGANKNARWRWRRHGVRADTGGAVTLNGGSFGSGQRRRRDRAVAIGAGSRIGATGCRHVSNTGGDRGALVQNGASFYRRRYVTATGPGLRFCSNRGELANTLADSGTRTAPRPTHSPFRAAPPTSQQRQREHWQQ